MYILSFLTLFFLLLTSVLSADTEGAILQGNQIIPKSEIKKISHSSADLAFDSNAHFTAEDIVGIWRWSGSGCRDHSLNVESHVSKPNSLLNILKIKTNIYHFYEDSSVIHVGMTKKRFELFKWGHYTITHNQIVFKVEEKENHSLSPGLSSIPIIFYLIPQGDQLTLIKKLSNFFYYFNYKICGKNRVFVRVFKKQK